MAKCLYQVRVITVFTVFRLLTDFVCLYNYEFGLSLCKIVRSSVIMLLPLFKHLQSDIICTRKTYWAKLFLVCTIFQDQQLIYIHVSLNFGLNISNMPVSSKPLGSLSLYCNICFRNLNNKKITFTKSHEYVCTWQTLYKTRE
jgi:hypothetical protein